MIHSPGQQTLKHFLLDKFPVGSFWSEWRRQIRITITEAKRKCFHGKRLVCYIVDVKGGIEFTSEYNSNQVVG
jgi:hypothetical protein